MRLDFKEIMKKDASTQLFWEVSGECKLAMLAVKVLGMSIV